ncbi:MAG: hypothetical protein K1X72_24845 [Pyrinomonadaceae bacterium]|nr:hypothetical protein [Pyrinomonadaceae bacterium]
MPKKAINTTNTPQIIFTGDFQQNITEEIKAGTEVTILFDSKRLPFERSVDKKGKPQWEISAFYQFSPVGPINEVKLVPEKKVKKAEATVTDEVLKGSFTVPAGSQEAILWFLNTGKSGEVYFDSAFGYNYRFPVLPEVAQVTEAQPKTVKKTRAKKA